jgi:hypothetical protein
MAFTDAGPDYNISFLNVMISWLAYCIMSGSDSLIVARTTPTQSWTNHAERLMSVLNHALSNCALSRKLMGEDFEKNMKKYNSMTSVRKFAEKLDSIGTHVVAPMAVVSATVVVDDDAASDLSAALTYGNIEVNGTFDLPSFLFMLLMML